MPKKESKGVAVKNGKKRRMWETLYKMYSNLVLVLFKEIRGEIIPDQLRF